MICPEEIPQVKGNAICKDIVPPVHGIEHTTGSMIQTGNIYGGQASELTPRAAAPDGLFPLRHPLGGIGWCACVCVHVSVCVSVCLRSSRFKDQQEDLIMTS